MSCIVSIFANVDCPVEALDVITEAMRSHLGMEIGYLFEFVGNYLVFRAVDAPGLEHLAVPGETRSQSDTCCTLILAGDLPQLISDTLDYPSAVALPITTALPIRAKVSAPIERSDGSIYGMFCCLTVGPNATLNDRDLQLMCSFASLAQAAVQRVLGGGKPTQSDAEGGP